MMTKKGVRYKKYITRPYMFVRFCFLYLVEIIEILYLWSRSFGAIPWNINSNVIVSLTSFPARIDSAWISIETIIQQDYKPSKIVLVLSKIEFVNTELPNIIKRQNMRGVEILWSEDNIKSYNKLLPVRAKYNDAIIITADDDIKYEKWRLKDLIFYADKHPKKIIGHRGKEVMIVDGAVAPYATWPEADLKSKSSNVFLTGVGMVYYPPYVLNKKYLLNKKLAVELCPLADDVWFWAVAKKSHASCICLGNNRTKPILKLSNTPALSNQNVTESFNDKQINKVIDDLEI